MKYIVLLSPSKEMNRENLLEKHNTINIKHFHNILDKLYKVTDFKQLKSNEDLTKEIANINKYSKRAIELYSGIAFRQLHDLDDEFYNKVVILSALYGYSLGGDLISPHRLDYTMTIGREFKKENLEYINKYLANYDVVYNLASNEFSQGLIHANIINFKFYDNGKLKSAISKKMRGAMTNYIKENSVNNFEVFNMNDFNFKEYNHESKTYIYVKEVS